MKISEASRFASIMTGRNILLVFSVLSVIPWLFVDVPPLTDAPGHMGRYHVALNLAHSPLLQANWDFRWQVIGNMGVDVLIVPLAKIFGLELGVRLICLVIPILTMVGICRCSLVLHRQITPFAIVALLLVWTEPFFEGFLNYCLGLALALNLFASWAAYKDRNADRMVSEWAFGVLAVGLWFVHLFAWGIFLLLAGSFEIGRNGLFPLRRLPSAVLAAGRRCLALTAPMLLMVWWQSTSRGGVGRFFNFYQKFLALGLMFKDHNITVDLVSCAFVVAVTAYLVIARRRSLHAGFALAAALLIILLLLLPYELSGTANVDTRMWPIAFIVLLCSARSRAPASILDATISGLAITLFVVRIGATSAGFIEEKHLIEQQLEALTVFPRGASIAVVTPRNHCIEPPDHTGNWRDKRIKHIDAMAVVRRDAFVNSEWAIEGAQMLVALRGRGTAFNSDPSQYIDVHSHCSTPIAQLVEQRVREIPRDRFDYIWLIGFAPQYWPTVAGWKPAYRGPDSIVYAQVAQSN